LELADIAEVEPSGGDRAAWGIVSETIYTPREREYCSGSKKVEHIGAVGQRKRDEGVARAAAGCDGWIWNGGGDERASDAGDTGEAAKIAQQIG